MKKTDVRVKRTYNQLVEAMLELLNKHNFETLSVSQICDKAGVHRATFYKHFNDKIEFINYCFENQLSAVSFDSMIENPTPDNIKIAIMNFVEKVLEFADENILLLSTVCSEKYYATLGSSFISALNTLCCKKISAVIPAPNHRIEIMANFYSSAFIGVIRWYVLNCNRVETAKADVLLFIEHRADELVEYYKNNMYAEA